MFLFVTRRGQDGVGGSFCGLFDRVLPWGYSIVSCLGVIIFVCFYLSFSGGRALGLVLCLGLYFHRCSELRWAEANCVGFTTMSL